MASGIVTMFDNIWQTIKGGFLKSWNWIVGKLNKSPGVNIDLSTTVPAEISKNERAALPVPELKQSVFSGGIAPTLTQNNYTSNNRETLTTNTLSTGGKLKDVDRGGISKTINSNSKSVTDNSRKIGEVHFHTKEALSPSQLMEWQELNA